MRHYIAILIAAFMLTGCSLIYENPDNPYPVVDDDDSEFVNLTFRMVMQPGNLSRSDNFHEEVNSENPSLEDRIYADDFIFYVYAGEEDSEEQAFIAKVDNSGVNTDPHTNISGGVGIYTVRVSIPKSDFEAVVPVASEVVKFRVVAFANTNKKYSELTPDDYGTFNSLMNVVSEWNFDIFRTVYSGTGGLQRNPRLPMFGTTEFSATRERLYDSRPDYPIRGEDMYMLRSLAKIKVVDNITSRDSNGLPHIDAVTIIGLPTAYTLPYDANKYKNGKQVHTARPCEMVDGNPVATRELNLPRDTDNNKLFVAYIPEQSINIPKLFIKVTFSLNADNTPLEQKTYEVPLSMFTDFGDALLRNHVYTLSVDMAGPEAELSVAVEPWVELPELTLDYTETVSISKKLEWTPDTYLSKSDETGEIVMKPWSNVQTRVSLDGEFSIQTPVGATWYAYILQTAGQDPGAFGFIQKPSDDSELLYPIIQNYISGTITEDNEPINLSIVTLNPEASGDEANKAIIQIVVHIGEGDSGSVVEAVMTPDGSHYRNYTIIQNPE